jgi:hypothetical protein
MMAVHTHLKLTYEDYLLIPNDGKRHELLDGEHFMTPSLNTRHQRIVGNLYHTLRAFFADHLLGGNLCRSLRCRAVALRCL